MSRSKPDSGAPQSPSTNTSSEASTLVDVANRGLEPLAISFEQCQQLTSLGRTSLFAAVGRREILSYKVGRRTLLDYQSVKVFLARARRA